MDLTPGTTEGPARPGRRASAGSMPRPGAGGAGGGRGLLAAALLLLAGPAASSQLKLAHTGSHVMELSAEDFNQVRGPRGAPAPPTRSPRSPRAGG